MPRPALQCPAPACTCGMKCEHARPALQCPAPACTYWSRVSGVSGERHDSKALESTCSGHHNYVRGLAQRIILGHGGLVGREMTCIFQSLPNLCMTACIHPTLSDVSAPIGCMHRPPFGVCICADCIPRVQMPQMEACTCPQTGDSEFLTCAPC